MKKLRFLLCTRDSPSHPWRPTQLYRYRPQARNTAHGYRELGMGAHVTPVTFNDPKE